MKRPGKLLLLCAGLALPGASLFSCNLGPFPDFLEELDPLDPVEGDVKGWILADDSKTQVLILSESGLFLHSTINRDTSVNLETGTYSIARGSLLMHSDVKYVFPSETGPVKDRAGAQSERIDKEVRLDVELTDGRLNVLKWGRFLATQDYIEGLDLTTQDGRGCLLKYVQLSIRTIQARTRNLGGGGTVIYHNNKSTFAGFLSGEESIVVDNLLSPDTTISYRDFSDFPEVQLNGSLVSHVNTAGDGTLDRQISFTILGPSPSTGVSPRPGDNGGAGGAGGAPGAPTQDAVPVLAEGQLIYGPNDPIRIEQADVAGGSYDLHLSEPLESADNFSWKFLNDLDLRACADFE